MTCTCDDLLHCLNSYDTRFVSEILKFSLLFFNRVHGWETKPPLGRSRKLPPEIETRLIKYLSDCWKWRILRIRKDLKPNIFHTICEFLGLRTSFPKMNQVILFIIILQFE